MITSRSRPIRRAERIRSAIRMVVPAFSARAASSPPHGHSAQVFVYVLEGRVNMQVKGGPQMTLGPGETFYEKPTDIHSVSANASTTEPAKFLVVMVKDKNATTTPAPAE